MLMNRGPLEKFIKKRTCASKRGKRKAAGETVEKRGNITNEHADIKDFYLSCGLPFYRCFAWKDRQ